MAAYVGVADFSQLPYLFDPQRFNICQITANNYVSSRKISASEKER